jgi:hypothetical protein
VPEVVIKSVFGGYFKQTANLGVNSSAQRVGRVGLLVKILEYFSEPRKNIFLAAIVEYYKL